jgi:hypothetical protein
MASDRLGSNGPAYNAPALANRFAVCGKSQWSFCLNNRFCHRRKIPTSSVLLGLICWLRRRSAGVCSYPSGDMRLLQAKEANFAPKSWTAVPCE